MLKVREEKFDLLYQRGVSRKNSIKFCNIDETKKISIISDSMFKTMIYNENRIKYAARLISFFIDVSYEELLKHLKLKKSDFNKEKEKEKSERGDFVADFNGTSIGIEVNNNDSLETMERNMEYAHREYSKKVTRLNKEYSYTQIIQLNINNFSFYGNDNITDIYVLRNKGNIVMSDKIIFIQIYIPNLIKKWYDKGKEGLTEEEKFLLVLTESDIETSYDIGDGIKYMNEFIKDASGASRDDDLLESYDKEWALRDQGKREGYEEGKKDTMIETAKKMKEDGMDYSLISKYTNISFDQIEKL